MHYLELPTSFRESFEEYAQWIMDNGKDYLENAGVPLPENFEIVDVCVAGSFGIHPNEAYGTYPDGEIDFFIVYDSENSYRRFCKNKNEIRKFLFLSRGKPNEFISAPMILDGRFLMENEILSRDYFSVQSSITATSVIDPGKTYAGADKP